MVAGDTLFSFSKKWLAENNGYDGGIVIPGELGTWKIFVGDVYDASDSSRWYTFKL